VNRTEQNGALLRNLLVDDSFIGWRMCWWRKGLGSIWLGRGGWGGKKCSVYWEFAIRGRFRWLWRATFGVFYG
jgi:hypothetical protein